MCVYRDRFRWVALQYDELIVCISKRELEDQLKKLPRGLNDTYAKILARSSRPGDLKRFLQCLAFSKRPMTVTEVAEAATINFGNDGSDVPMYESDRRFENPKDILGICYGLITEVEGAILSL